MLDHNLNMRSGCSTALLLLLLLLLLLHSLVLKTTTEQEQVADLQVQKRPVLTHSYTMFLCFDVIDLNRIAGSTEHTTAVPCQWEQLLRSVITMTTSRRSAPLPRTNRTSKPSTLSAFPRTALRTSNSQQLLRIYVCRCFVPRDTRAAASTPASPPSCPRTPWQTSSSRRTT